MLSNSDIYLEITVFRNEPGYCHIFGKLILTFVTLAGFTGSVQLDSKVVSSGKCSFLGLLRNQNMPTSTYISLTVNTLKGPVCRIQRINRQKWNITYMSMFTSVYNHLIISIIVSFL